MIDDIKAIQRHVGAEPDGVFGPVTAQAVLLELSARAGLERDEPPVTIDERTRSHIATLDAKARERFVQFVHYAKATAATMGCDYIAISGTRTWEEQQELRRKYLKGGPKAAPAGYSWHNFGTALDFGVFQGGGKIYCDASKPELAQRVHAACAAHAKACGLEWGGDWKGRDCDPPHYQIDMGHSSPTAADRAKYQKEGSVL